MNPRVARTALMLVFMLFPAATRAQTPTAVPCTHGNATQPYIDEAYERVNERVYRGAIDLFTCAIAADPPLAEAYMNRGAAYALLGDVELAFSDYNRTLQLAQSRQGAFQSD